MSYVGFLVQSETNAPNIARIKIEVLILSAGHLDHFVC